MDRLLTLRLAKRAYFRLNSLFSRLVYKAAFETGIAKDNRTEIRALYSPFYRGIKSIVLGKDVEGSPFELPKDDDLTQDQLDILLALRHYLIARLEDDVDSWKKAITIVEGIKDCASTISGCTGQPYVKKIRELCSFVDTAFPSVDQLISDNKIVDGWPPIGTRLYAQYDSEYYAAEIVLCMKGRKLIHSMMLILTGPSTGICCSSPTVALEFATIFIRKKGQKIRSGWDNWMYNLSEIGDGSISSEVARLCDDGEIRDEKEFTTVVSGKIKARNLPSTPVANEVISRNEAKSGFDLAEVSGGSMATLRATCRGDKDDGAPATSSEEMNAVVKLLKLDTERTVLDTEVSEREKRLGEIAKEISEILKDTAINQLRDIIARSEGVSS